MRLPEYKDLIEPRMDGTYSLTLIPTILGKMNEYYITERFLDKLERRPYSDNNLAKLYCILRKDNSEYLNIIFNRLNRRLSYGLRGIFTRIDFALDTKRSGNTGENANPQFNGLEGGTFEKRHKGGKRTRKRKTKNKRS